MLHTIQKNSTVVVQKNDRSVTEHTHSQQLSKTVMYISLRSLAEDGAAGAHTRNKKKNQ
jgi:hypothetical protein